MDPQRSLLRKREIEKIKLSATIARFALEMQLRLYQKVDEGYEGWDREDGWTNQLPEERLLQEASILAENATHPASPPMHPDHRARKLVDAAAFAMFAWALDH